MHYPSVQRQRWDQQRGRRMRGHDSPVAPGSRRSKLTSALADRSGRFLRSFSVGFSSYWDSPILWRPAVLCTPSCRSAHTTNHRRCFLIIRLNYRASQPRKSSEYTGRLVFLLRQSSMEMVCSAQLPGRKSCRACPCKNMHRPKFSQHPRSLYCSTRFSPGDDAAARELYFGIVNS